MIDRETLLFSTLLHDIGKFWQRTGKNGQHAEIGAQFIDEFSNLFPYRLLDDIRGAIGKHHRDVHKDIEKIVKLADWFSAGERVTEEGLERRMPHETPLIPVASEVEFQHNRPEALFGFNLNPLRIERDVLFPLKYEDAKVSRQAYNDLWECFVKELKEIGSIDGSAGFVSLYFLLRKYTLFIPSATPWEKEEKDRTFPDVSLFEHLRTTCAIAACLDRVLSTDEMDGLLRCYEGLQKKPVCFLVRGDVSGIQKFIYSITRPQTETKGTAKRLRGRSFYLSLLTDVIADWLVRELDLPIANILFCGGGAFDLLAPCTDEVKNQLENLERELANWLLDEFQGEIGLQLAWVKVAPEDFENFTGVYGNVSDKMASKKQRKFEPLLTTEQFFKTEQQAKHVCNYCHVTPLKSPEDEPCKKCDNQSKIGKKLPETNFIAFVYGAPADSFGNIGEAVRIPFDKFGVDVLLLDNVECENFVFALTRLAQSNPRVTLYKLNDTNFLPSAKNKSIGFGFKFLGNSAPVALEDLPAIKPNLDPIDKGDVLDFDEIAYLSPGAQLLGVLKMDVDFLGLIFSLGVEPKSISRISTLSGSLDIFFSTWLNEICKQLTDEWNQNTEHDFKGKIKDLFYTVYSGGDDLLIIGPWEQTINLAQRIYSDFREYTCQNDNITLSGGMALVKPRFPIQRFVHIADEELKKSKKERDRITLFGETVCWKDEDKGLEELLKFGKDLVEYVEKNEMPKSFIYFLMQLRKQFFDEDGKDNKVWIPKFFYAASRRLSDELLKELELFKKVPAVMKHIRIPACYVSLITRKE